MSTDEPRPEQAGTGSTPEYPGYTPQGYSADDETRIIPGGAAAGQQPYGQNPGVQPQYGQGQHSQNQYGHQGYAEPQQYGQGTYSQNQYGQQASGYSTQGAAPYEQQQYGQSQYGDSYASSYGQQYGSMQPGSGYVTDPTPAYASWGSRVGARLIDGLIAGLPAIILGILGLSMAFGNAHEVTDFDGTKTIEGINGTGLFLAFSGFLLSLILNFWNLGMRQGKTGQSIGKKILKIKVVDERTGQPAGTGMGIARFVAEAAISFASGFTGGILSLVDLLWPLWDNKNQTLHDKMVHTVVVQAPQA